jgi:hypothetical protein
VKANIRPVTKKYLLTIISYHATRKKRRESLGKNQFRI